MSTPTINVNLKACNLACRELPSTVSVGGHHPACNARPVLIPCPLPPAVTFEVVLECPCDLARCDATHAVKVVCSISGKTWEESEARVDMVGDADGAWIEAHLQAIDGACRVRWALVKALVLGRDEWWRNDPKSDGWNLQPQRDAVYADLVEMARAEEVALAAQRRLAEHRLQIHGPAHMARPQDRPSAAYLAAFVARLIQQIGGSHDAR